MMKWVNVLVLALSVYSYVPVSYAQLTNSVSIELTRAPTGPHDEMYARINGADDKDPTRNPCYGMEGCYIAAWAVDGSWTNKYKTNYMTYDTDSQLAVRQECGRRGSTVGEVVKCLRDKNALYVEMHDNLPAARGENAEMCLFINQGEYMSNGAALGPLGGCAKIYIPSKCTYTGSLDIHVAGSPSDINGAVGTSSKASGDGSVLCDKDTSGTLRVANSTGEVILDNGGLCSVDLGAGPGASLPLMIRGGRPYRITASCLFSGVEKYGVHRGQTIVMFSID